MSELFKRKLHEAEEVTDLDAVKEDVEERYPTRGEDTHTPGAIVYGDKQVPAPPARITILSLLEDIDSRMNTLLEKQREFLEGLD